MRCEIIEDLLPLYLDDACNEETRKAVEEHLASCEKCREKAENWKNDYVVKLLEDEKINKRLEEGELLVKREKKIRREGRFTVFGWGVLADSVMILSIIVLIIVKLAGIPNLDMAMIPVNVLGICGVGVVGEWIFLIGKFIMKKDMQMMGAFSGLFMITQFAVVVIILIIGYMAAMYMEPMTFWESLSNFL